MYNLAQVIFPKDYFKCDHMNNRQDRPTPRMEPVTTGNHRQASSMQRENPEYNERM